MDTKAPKFCQHLRAENSPNGNPQRLYIVYDDAGKVLSVIDEGYRGLPKELRDLAHLPDVVIPKSEYHSWKREFKAQD
jgi:hypothetical protein